MFGILLCFDISFVFQLPVCRQIDLITTGPQVEWFVSFGTLPFLTSEKLTFSIWLSISFLHGFTQLCAYIWHPDQTWPSTPPVVCCCTGKYQHEGTCFHTPLSVLQLLLLVLGGRPVLRILEDLQRPLELTSFVMGCPFPAHRCCFQHLIVPIVHTPRQVVWLYSLGCYSI